MAITIVYLVMNIIRTYAVYDFINNFLSIRRFSKHIIIGFCSFYYLIVSFIFLRSNPPIFMIAANLLMSFFLCMLYNATLWNRLLATAFIYILSMASENLVSCTMDILFIISPTNFLTETNTTIIGITISMVFLLVLVKLVKPLFRYQDTPLPYFYWFAVFLIPSFSIGIQYLLVEAFELYPSAFILPIQLSTLLLLVINILVFYLYKQLVKKEAIRYENMLLSQQNDAYENQSLLVHDFQQSLREQRHDMNTHLATLLEFSKLQNSDKLQDYLHKLLDSTASAESGINSGDSLIDAMVNSKLYLTSQQHTQLCTGINLRNSVNINPIDLTIILGNLLDNALEACLKLPDDQRKIWLRITNEHNTLAIEVTNTYDSTALDVQNGKFKTTKQNKENHGIGMNNIHQVVAKYNGSVEFTQTSEQGQPLFIAELLLYLS